MLSLVSDCARELHDGFDELLQSCQRVRLVYRCDIEEVCLANLSTELTNEQAANLAVCRAALGKPHESGAWEFWTADARPRPKQGDCVFAYEFYEAQAERLYKGDKVAQLNYCRRRAFEFTEPEQEGAAARAHYTRMLQHFSNTSDSPIATKFRQGALFESWHEARSVIDGESLGVDDSLAAWCLDNFGPEALVVAAQLPYVSFRYFRAKRYQNGHVEITEGRYSNLTPQDKKGEEPVFEPFSGSPLSLDAFNEELHAQQHGEIFAVQWDYDYWKLRGEVREAGKVVVATPFLCQRILARQSSSFSWHVVRAKGSEPSSVKTARVNAVAAAANRNYFVNLHKSEQVNKTDKQQ